MPYKAKFANMKKKKPTPWADKLVFGKVINQFGSCETFV
jgi:hypothetical protein